MLNKFGGESFINLALFAFFSAAHEKVTFNKLLTKRGL